MVGDMSWNAVTNHAQGFHKFARYPSYPGFHSLPMVDVSMTKAIWDKLPEDLKTILTVSVDKLAYDLVFNLKKLDLKAIQDAKKDASIELVNMAPEERAKFRQIAQQEWKVWAAKNEMTQKVYDAAVKFLTERNLM